jgi:hypothetical protein
MSRLFYLALFTLVACETARPAPATLCRPMLAPPNACERIPSYSGISAGQQFRHDVSNHVSALTGLAVEHDGEQAFCADCVDTNLGTGDGSGATAIGTNSAASCDTRVPAIGPPIKSAGGDPSTPNPNLTVNPALMLTATVYGAKADAIFSGDGMRLADGATAGTTFTSASGNFKSALAGDTIAIDGAGASGALYVGSVSSVTNSTTILLRNATPTNVVNANYVIGYDNTRALQTWINAIRNTAPPNMPKGYLPVGNYLHRGLDFSEIYNLQLEGAGGDVMLTAAADASGVLGGSALICIAPTTNPAICHDFSGNAGMDIHHLTFRSGTTRQQAGSVNVLTDRLGFSWFGIANKWEDDVFQAWGTYDVVLYGAEQSSFIDCIFNWDADPAKALYISGANTPEFTSPTRGSLVAPPTSMTIVSLIGGKQQISSNGEAAITFDGAISDFNIIGGYIRLNGPTDIAFTDTGAGSYISDMQEVGVRTEPQQAGDQYMVLAGGLGGSSFIGGTFYYPNGVTATASPWVISAASGNNWQNWNENSFRNPEITIASGANNRFDNVNRASLQIPLTDTGRVNAYSGQVVANAFDSEPHPVSFTGTTGTATCSQSLQGTLKVVTCSLSAYQQTGRAQTFTFPTAFTTAPAILEQASGTATGGGPGSCGTYHASASANLLTLPADPVMTAENCNVIAIGQ